MWSLLCRISSSKVIKYWILEIHLKINYSLIFSSFWHLWHFIITVELLSIYSFFYRLLFILKTTFIACMTSAIPPWFSLFLSGCSYSVSTSSCFLLDTCEYIQILSPSLNYSFFILEVTSFFCGFYISNTWNFTCLQPVLYCKHAISGITTMLQPVIQVQNLGVIFDLLLFLFNLS